jgi:class 3 adenylate cyclase/tetratricopeptide (TPR) repeat protein
MAACLRCGEANPARARFCLACGAPLGEPATAREMRKTVTVVFSDVIDSTPLGEHLDAEAYRRVISRYFIEVSRVLERHGGTVEKFIGDAVMAVFGIPVVHEDDALRAVRAATELREALAALNQELRREYGIELAIRTGINTGEVVAGDSAEGQAFATGDAVAVAQRLESASSSGEILIGETTHRLVRNAVLVEPLDPLSLKGKSEPVHAWRLLGVLAGAPAFARRLDSPLVGRERELALLEQAFGRAVDERACHMFTVLGAAGVGKSRLANEVLSSLSGKARVLIGHCTPYGEGNTFWPLTELVRQAASISRRLPAEEARGRLVALLKEEPEAEMVADRIGAATGIAEGDASGEETFWAVRKLLEAMAQEQPLVVGFDDLQWAEPTFLDLIDYLADWTKDAPVLIVCLARPELLDERPAWGGGKLNTTSILLEPLREADIKELIANLLGEGEIAEHVPRSLGEASEGNPLFVEEMLRMLIEEGELKREDGNWVAAGGLASVKAPPTIEALLAARLDRLERGDRAVLERAAVVGKLFSREALTALVPAAERLDEHLASLVRKDLIRADRTDAEAFGFRHILIRDAAYLALAKEARAELHEHFATWLESARPGREYQEILGYHLEQAHRYRAELAPPDRHTRELATRGAESLVAAGRRAFARGDAPAAVGLLTRATLLLRDDEEARLEIAPDLGAALVETGDLMQADAVLSRTIAAADASGDRQLELRAELERAWVDLRGEATVGAGDLQAIAERGIATFEGVGDEVGLARAWFLLSAVHWLASRWGARTEALERALLHARRAGHRRQEAVILGALPLSLSWGSTPIPEAIGRCQELLAQAEGVRTVEAKILVVLAELEGGLGNFDDARRLYKESQAILEELGLRLLLGIQSQAGGTIELLAGDPQAAENELRWGLEMLQKLGANASTVAALLGGALYEQGRYDEAERLTQLSESATADEDVACQILYRGVRAKVHARRGELEEAERLARQAAALAVDTDALTVHGDALMNLAEVLRLAGREAEAAPVADEARALYEAKGNTVLRARAKAWLAVAGPA